MGINDTPFGSTPHRVITHGALESVAPPDPMLEQIENWFTYHAPSPEHVSKYNSIRENAKILAKIIVLRCPPSADRTHAIRCLRDAVMWANASVACGGK